MNNEMEAHECKAARSSDGERIKLTFLNDSGESREVIFLIGDIPQFFSVLQQEIGSDPFAPIERSALDVGKAFAVSAFQVRPISGGGCLIALTVEMLDLNRVVIIPLEFSPKDLETLFSMIIGKNNGSAN